jgi:hypothetical protein
MSQQNSSVWNDPPCPALHCEEGYERIYPEGQRTAVLVKCRFCAGTNRKSVADGAPLQGEPDPAWIEAERNKAFRSP